MSDTDGLRWLLFHEVTHVAQFRAAPWITDSIVGATKQALSINQPGFARDLVRQLPDKLPELLRWAREALEGKATSTPIFELLPDEQRDAIMNVHALVTLLEGHATHVTELIAKRVLPGHEEINRRIAARRKRPPLMRLLEAISGIEMKRQQYVIGKGFCEAVWEHGGAEALAPAWRGPEWAPTRDELKEPDRWLARVALQTPA
jgi:putative hydrolase